MQRPKQPSEDPAAFFEKLYRKEDHLLGVQPSEGVSKALPFLLPGRVLDLGAGDGRNTLFLAQRGFDVTGVDIAPTAIDNLNRFAARSGLSNKARGIAADISTYAIEEPFENIISTFTLHFLTKEAFPIVLDTIMQGTIPGGVNLIEDFIQDGPLYKPGTAYYWLETLELRHLYERRGWHVLDYAEGTTSTKATDENGNPYTQGKAAIIARKPA